MPSALSPSSGNELPGYLPPPLKWPVLFPDFTEFNPVAEWPQNVIQAQPRRVLPSFGTAGIPRPTTVSPAPTTGAGAFSVIPPAGTGTPAAGGAQFTTLANVKNPAIDARLAEILKTFDTVSKSTPEEFVTRLRAAGPQFEGFTQQDIANLSDISGPGLETKLQGLRANRRAAVRSAADRALGDLTRILSLGRMGQSTGAAPLGQSSYLTKLGLDKASEIETGAALDQAAQERADLDYLNQLRLGTLGKRGELLQTDIGRSLLPSQVNAQWFNQLMSSLLPIVSASNANTFYGLQGPGGYVGDSYGGLQSSRLADLGRVQQANQFDISTALQKLNADRTYELAKQNQQMELLRTLLQS